MSRNVSRPLCVAVHYNAWAPDYRVCDQYDGICGVKWWPLDRWVSSCWSEVTCGRCLRKKPSAVSTSGKCSNVESVECEAAANYPGSVRTKCFNCGDFVCRPCSRVQPWRRWKKKRICTLCNKGER